MTTPTGYHDYEAELGPGSPQGRQEWELFKQRRQEVIDSFLNVSGQLGAQVGLDGHDPNAINPIGGPVSTTDQMAQQQESRRDLIARASYWRIPNPDQLSTADLQTQLAMKRAEIKQAPQTSYGSAGQAFGGATEAGVSTAARLTGNLLENVVGQAPFIGETLRGILNIDRAKNWLYDWSSKLDESSQMITAGQPSADRTAAQFLTAAGKVAGTAIPMIAAWEGLGAAGAGFAVPGWLARASTPLTRFAVRGALSSAIFDDPNASPGEKAVNLGLGAILGGAQVYGRLGLAAGGAAVGAGVGSGIGDTPAERQRNQIIGGIGGAILPFLSPMAAAAYTKTKQGFKTPFDTKMSDAINQSTNPGWDGTIHVDEAYQYPGESMAEVIGPPQVSGNPPPKQLAGPQGQLPRGQGTGEISNAEDLASLMRWAPTKSLQAGEAGQTQTGPQAVSAPRVAGLLPATTEYSEQGRFLLNDVQFYNRVKDWPNSMPDDVAGAIKYGPAAEDALDKEIFATQRYAPPEAKGLASVTFGPAHLLGSKVVDANGKPLRVFHGTGVDFETFDPTKLDKEALWGPGLYHTESYDIAGGVDQYNGGYAGEIPDASSYELRIQLLDKQIENMQAIVDAGQTDDFTGASPDYAAMMIPRYQAEQASIREMMNQAMARRPNVRPAYLDIKNPFEVEKMYSTEEMHDIVNRLEARVPGYDWNAHRVALNDPEAMLDYSGDFNFTAGDGRPRGDSPLSGSDFYQMLEGTMLSSPAQGPIRNLDTSWWSPNLQSQIDKAGLNNALREIGYDGITHIGGAITGNKPHRVWIAFDPSQVHMPWDVAPLTSKEAVETAQLMTKQATVMESATLPDAMGKPLVTESDAVSALKSSNPGGVSLLRDVGNAIGVLLEHPDVNYVLRDGKLDVFVGEVTQGMMDDYKHWGVYESQVVQTPKGQEGTVLHINGRGMAVIARKGGGPPIRIKASKLLPGRFGDPIRSAPDLWDSFKADLMNHANSEFDKASMAPADGIFDSRIGDMMQNHLEDYLDRRGINDPADRQVIDAYINQRYVEEAKDLDPEMRDLQAAMTDLSVGADNASENSDLAPVVSTEELAASKGFIWIKDPGKPGGILRDNLNAASALEIPIASEFDVPEFLKNMDRAAPDETPTSTVPFDVAESVPHDTEVEPRAGVEETIDNAADAGWRKFAVESVPLRNFGAQHAEAIRNNTQEATRAINDILDKADRARQEARDARVGAGGGGGELPPADVSGAGFDPWPRRLPPDHETLGDQFEDLKKHNLPAYMELGSKYKNVLFRYTRYLMAGLERDLVNNGIDMGRAWRQFEALDTARIFSDNEAHPWLNEYGDIMRQFDPKILRDGSVTRIHEIEDLNLRHLEWDRLLDRGFSKDEISQWRTADEHLTDFNHRWFQFLTGDDAFAVTADREIYRYMAHVRARQAVGGRDPFDSTGWLSPNTEFFADFARENNMQFRVMDARELGTHMIRSAMFKKYQDAPYNDLVNTWSDSRVPEPIRNLMLDHARAMKYGYDASGDFAVKAVKTVFQKMLGVVLSTHEASKIVGAPVSGMYMSMLGGKTSIFFRDAIQPLMALAKVRVPTMAGVYRDILSGGREEILRHGLEGGWVLHEAPHAEGLGLFEEQPGLRANELMGLTPEQTARREQFAQVGDVLAGLPDVIARPSESSISTLKYYGKLQQLNRAIVGEAAHRQATAALAEYRHSQIMAALSKDPALAIPYKKFARDSFFSSFEEPIANRLQELVDASEDGEAANLFARETAKWSQHVFSRREQPKAIRGGFGRMLFTLGNFSGQFLEGVNSAMGNGEPMHKARFGMTVGAVTGALLYAGAKTGWSFGKWAWTSALKYSGGPAVDYLAQIAAAAGGAVALSDDRKPSPFQSEALKATIGQSIVPNPMTFLPYSGYVKSAAEYSAAAQGTNPVEQAARFAITGDRGSRIDEQRASQQQADRLSAAIEARANERAPILRNPGYIPGGYPDSIPGMVQRGNLDLSRQPRYQNADGSVSTVRSISVGIDGRETLIPTIAPNGRSLTPEQAVQLYRITGRHLGIFSDTQSANAYAQQLHQREAQRIGHPGNGALP